LTTTGYIFYWDTPDVYGDIWKRSTFDPSMLQILKKKGVITDYECTKAGVKITCQSNVNAVNKVKYFPDELVPK
jgi:hypothetical protein